LLAVGEELVNGQPVVVPRVDAEVERDQHVPAALQILYAATGGGSVGSGASPSAGASSKSLKGVSDTCANVTL
jgi:hypothetical protein